MWAVLVPIGVVGCVITVRTAIKEHAPEVFLFAVIFALHAALCTAVAVAHYNDL